MEAARAELDPMDHLGTDPVKHRGRKKSHLHPVGEGFAGNVLYDAKQVADDEVTNDVDSAFADITSQSAAKQKADEDDRISKAIGNSLIQLDNKLNDQATSMWAKKVTPEDDAKQRRDQAAAKNRASDAGHNAAIEEATTQWAKPAED